MEKWGVVLLVGIVVCAVAFLWRLSEPLRKQIRIAQAEDRWNSARAHMTELSMSLVTVASRTGGDYKVYMFPAERDRMDLALTRKGKQVFTLTLQEREKYPQLHGEGSFCFPPQALRFNKYSQLGWKKFTKRLLLYLEQYERDRAQLEASWAA